MALGSLFALIIALVVIFIVGYVAKWLIDTYFPPPIQTPALVIVGLLLLLVLLYVLVGHLGVSLR